MHTLDELEAADFQYVSDGQAVGKDEFMPPISLEDRLGVVMENGVDGLGAGNFILASVIDFYDTLREQREGFFEYPDFYTFQATTEPADYRMLDIYPDHKNVRAEGNAESILRAVNDRAVDILLVPDRTQGSPEITDITRRSAQRRIESCFLYSPRGRLVDFSFAIEVPSDPVTDWFDTTADSNGESVEERWWGEDHQEAITQEFRRIPLERALERLPNAHA